MAKTLPEMAATDIKIDPAHVRFMKHLSAGTWGKPSTMQAAKRGRVIYSHSYDGEKDFGEIGPVRSYLPDYQMLRLRSWQAYLESDIARMAIDRFATWVIGSGLKLQSEPSKRVLEDLGINVTAIQDFSKTIESYYQLFCKSKRADYAKMKSKNKLSKKAFIESIVGGDVLIVLRFDEENSSANIELIDGGNVKSPHGGNEVSPELLQNGNRIENGVELTPKDEHAAYWVENSALQFDRIPAKGLNGVTTAFLVYGSEYRLATHRGMPLIAVVLETIKKLERYKEAAVGSAEEREKIAYFFEHGVTSTGENPMIQQLAQISGTDLNNDIPIDDAANALADRVAATTKKQVFNLPKDSTVKAIEAKGQLYFKDFFTVNAHVLFACIGIPPNVAMQIYDSNYSASRAAIKDWEHNLNVRRDDWAEQFEEPIFYFWTFSELIKGTFKAPKLLLSWVKGRSVVVEAYLKARFVGAPVPHIDPYKEVQAEREKLGPMGANLPLTTLEQATENLGGGDSDSNMEQFAVEIEAAKKLKIDMPAPAQNAPNPVQ